MKFWEQAHGAFELVLDAIMPPRARSARTRARSIDQIPLEVMAHELLGARVITLMDYRKAAVQDLIRALKYDASRHAAHMTAMLLADYLREEIASIKLFSQKPILLIPVPLHKTRRAERGYNQIELVLRALPSEFTDGTLARVAPQALVRTRATPHQTKLKRAERIKNIAGAFAMTDISVIRNVHIFLIDDVTTTGATLKSAGEPLTKAGAEVTLLALARA
jgi:ComF family protein